MIILTTRADESISEKKILIKYNKHARSSEQKHLNPEIKVSYFV